MTCGMPRKRSTDSTLPDHSRSKKRPKSASLVNLKSHINLRWDESSKRVIPTKEQIGIPWSHLAPFIDSPCKRSPGLADVSSVPREIYALETLSEVLSYEVWDTCLTESERTFLAQFLPAGINADETAHTLLTGKNHHFGNPFLSWSSALCYGNLHPDAVLSKKQQIKLDKKAYCADLNNYHSDMMEILTKWKEKWLTCDNPESFFRDIPAKQKQAELQSPGENIIFSKAPKNEMSMKVARNGDVSKFMSYIKISRSQHDLVKRMKQSGDGIQTKHLTPVIGDIDNFHVKPYETLEEDEKEKLRNHWAILSCKDLPAAFKAHRERKLLIDNLRTSLSVELAERSMPAVEKAEQVAARTAYQNGDILDGHEELVEHSPQDVLQDGNDSSLIVEELETGATSDADACIRSHDNSPNMKDQDVMNMNNTNTITKSQNSPDEQDQDLEKNTSNDAGNSSDVQDEDLENISYRNGISRSYISVGVGDEDMKDNSYQDTILQDHNILDMQAQEPKVISPYMLVQDFKNNSYTGLPIHGLGDLDEQTDDVKNMSYPSASTVHDMNDIPLSDSNKVMNHLLVDQKEADSNAMIPSDSAFISSKPLRKHNNMEESLELKEPAAKCEKDLWQSASPVGSFYHPPVNSMYTQSGNLLLKHHLSGGLAASMIDLRGDARGRLQAQVSAVTALPIGNAAPLLQPCTNQLNNQQLQNSAKGIGMVPSFSVGHLNGIKQSTDLCYMTNGRLAQSGMVQDQMQLLDQRHNVLYLQQQLGNNLYSGAGLCTQETFPMVEQEIFAVESHTAADKNCGWLGDEHPSHDSWSGMEPDGMDLAGGSSADGSLLSVLSHYKQTSQLGASSSDHSLGRRNLLVSPPRAQGVVAPRAENMYGYTQNVDGGSVNNLQWVANLGQGRSHGMADPSSLRQFGAEPWSR